MGVNKEVNAHKTSFTYNKTAEWRNSATVSYKFKCKCEKRMSKTKLRFL
jgi:hypothetical protein